MRQLIFKIMTKAFGSLWVEKTISEEIKNNLKKMISIYYPDIAKDKVSRDEKIIEEALYQMDISELEKFLFEESREIDPSILIDSNLTQGSLNNMDKDEIIAVIDKGRLKSLWERFFASKIPIENPKSKISELRILRNKVAHSKPFSLNDYKKAEELHDQFISHLENAIENIEMIKYEPFFISDVLSGFSSALIKSINISEQIGKMISPAISQLADIGLAASKMLQNSLRAQLPDIIKASQIAAQFKPVLPDLSIASKITEQINFRNNLLSTSMAEDILKKQDVVKNAFGARIDYSKLFHNPAIEALENRQRMLDAMIPKFPVFDAIQRQEIDDLEDDQLADEKIDDEEHLNCDDVINSEEDTQND